MALSVRNTIGRIFDSAVTSAQQPFIRTYVRLAVQDPTITAKESFDFWRSKGAPYHVCWSCLGNEQRETGFNWKAVGDHGNAHGIVQWWWEPRGAAILEGTGIDVRTADHPQQLAAMYWELSQARLWAPLLATADVQEACDLLVRKYERPAQTERDIALQVKFANALRAKHMDWEVPVVPIAPVAAQKPAVAPVAAVSASVAVPKPAAPAPAVVNGSAPSPLPIPSAWLSKVAMKGIVVHWTAGNNKPTLDDTQHYHVLIAGDGTLVRGTHTIADNVDTSDGVYAAHTLHHNTGIIGVSLCGMLDAVEQPFSAGPQPINEKQWAILPIVLAQLCRFYGITPDRRSVLSHAEVQDTLGIPQRGKWDISRLPWNLKVQGAHVIGDGFRKATADAMKTAVPVA